MDLRERNASLGSHHPWERARSVFLRHLLNILSFSTSTRVLEMGSGDCWRACELLNGLPAD